MVGVVTTRHLLTHSAVIVHEFGTLCLLRCFWRTLTADHAVTFLECAVHMHGNGAYPSLAAMGPGRSGATLRAATPTTPARIERGCHFGPIERLREHRLSTEVLKERL